MAHLSGRSASPELSSTTPSLREFFRAPVVALLNTPPIINILPPSLPPIIVLPPCSTLSFQPASLRPTASMLEQELVEIKLPGRDPVLPTLYYSIGHPLVPEGKRCIVFIHNTSPTAMRTVHAWEKKQQIPSATEKGDLDALGLFEVPEDMLIFARDSASTDASSDALQAWLTPARLVSQEARTQLQEAADAAMGPSESITLEAPVRDAEGNWSGGLAIERGDGRCKPVKEDTRCYTLANSYQSQKGIWSPASQSQYCALQYSASAVAPFPMAAMQQMPESTRKDIEDHTSMLNIPALGLPGNTAHNTLQLNVAPAQRYGSEKTLANSLGFYGGNHNDNKDSPARFPNMVMCSRLPDTYTLSKFHIPRLGIYFTLRNFDSANFCGLNYHGGIPRLRPRMGDGLGHVVVGAMPTATDPVLKICESRLTRASTTQANFAVDGQVVMDVRAHVIFMARMFLLLLIFLSNQLPPLLRLSHRFRPPAERFFLLRRWANSGVFHDKFFEVDEHGDLKDSPVLVYDRVDMLGNPIEPGGRPYAKPALPMSKKKADRKALANQKHAPGSDSDSNAAPRKRLRSGKSKAVILASSEEPSSASSESSQVRAKPKNVYRSATKRLADFQQKDATLIWHSTNYVQINHEFVTRTSSRAPTTSNTLAAAPQDRALLVEMIDSEGDIDIDLETSPLDAVEQFFQDAGGIKLVDRLTLSVISRDHLAVKDAYQLLQQSSHLPISASSLLDDAFKEMLASPDSLETCLSIARIWPQFEHLQSGDAGAALSLKLRRQSIMQTTFVVWTWLDTYCAGQVRSALADAAPRNWIGRLAKHVHTLMSTRAPSRELRPAEFGLPGLDGVYKFHQRKSLDLDIPYQLIVTIVLDIIALWLHFPTKANSRAQAWFIDTLIYACHPATLFLDSVWFAFGHLETEVFGDRNAKIPAPSAFAPLASALYRSHLCDRTSEEFLLMTGMQQMLYEYQTHTITAIAAPSPRDSRQLQFMNLFLGYLLELEPLIDGYEKITQPTAFQAAVNGKADFLLPFREHGPCRARSRLPGMSFDPRYVRTQGGLLSGLIFRAVIFSTPFALQANTFFSSPDDWRSEYASFASKPDAFFCNLAAYSRRKSNRGIHLVDEHWKALNAPGCPDWEQNTRHGKYDFADCFKFLSASNPSRFREIGDLIGFLLTADFVYAGAVRQPSPETVGGMKGLEMLELTPPRERGVSGGFKKANVDEVKAGFSRLYRFLDAKLPQISKDHMVFDAIMVENSLCKMTRWHALKLILFVLHNT
ncbi:hypothetical protein B0H17DRAFT_1149274 [Mycena rosella]|uniref:Uncharacterized protein n=1 Tax=Mycena rosella TaxID=1033263 RepID=A0AAD7C3A3_MYCRO|nr:hypothetical protein B0H17DRAFT_1149274 [Mycena rosella]